MKEFLNQNTINIQNIQNIQYINIQNIINQEPEKTKDCSYKTKIAVAYGIGAVLGKIIPNQLQITDTLAKNVINAITLHGFGATCAKIINSDYPKPTATEYNTITKAIQDLIVGSVGSTIAFFSRDNIDLLLQEHNLVNDEQTRQLIGSFVLLSTFIFTELQLANGLNKCLMPTKCIQALEKQDKLKIKLIPNETLLFLVNTLSSIVASIVFNSIVKEIYNSSDNLLEKTGEGVLLGMIFYVVKDFMYAVMNINGNKCFKEQEKSEREMELLSIQK